MLKTIKIKKRHLLILYLVFEIIFIISVTNIFYSEFMHFTNKEYESPSNYDFYDANEKNFKIDAKDIVPNEDNSAATATVTFKDGIRKIHLLPSPEKMYIDPNTDFKGRFVAMYEEGAMWESKGETFKSFLKEPLKKRDLNMIIIAVLDFFIWLVLNYKKLNPPKIPVIKEGHFLSEKQLEDILEQQPVIDDIWLNDKYLVVNENNYVTVVELLQIIWLYSEVSTKYGVGKFIIKIRDKKYKEINISINGRTLETMLYALLENSTPHAVHGYSAEKALYYKENKETFVSRFVGENEPSLITEEKENEYKSALTDMINREIRENSTVRIPTKKEFDNLLNGLFLQSAHMKDVEERTLSDLSAFSLLNIAVFFINLISITDKYLPMAIKEFFYVFGKNPALSMLRAIYYSGLLTSILIAILIIAAIIFMRKLINTGKNNVSNNIAGFSLNILIIFLLIFTVAFPKPKIDRNLAIYNPKAAYEDICQIKTDTLTERDVLVEENLYFKNQNIFYYPHKKFFYCDRTPKYAHLEMTAQDYPFAEHFRRIDFNLPWKTDRPVNSDEVKFYVENMDDEKAIENSFYKIYYTDNYSIVVHMKRLFADEKYIF